MDTLFFWISKLTWVVISPDSLLVILAAAGLFLLCKKAYKPAKVLIGTVVFIMIIITLFPLGEWLLYPLETRFATNPKLPDKVDGIIVLSGASNPYGSAYWQQVELNGSAERIFAFMRLIKKYPHAVHVFTGGSGSMKYQQYKHAHTIQKLFQEQGVDTAGVVFEALSRNTYENARFSHAKVKPKPGERWILITTAYHMPRSVGIFQKLRWQVIPYPVDHYTNPENLFRVSTGFAQNLFILKTAAKEWIGLAAYFLTGKTNAILPH